MFQKLLILVLLCIFGGCATTQKMALDPESTKLDVSTKSMVLLAIHVYRTDGSRFVPEPNFIQLKNSNAKDAQKFKLSKQNHAVQEDGHSIYLANMDLEPGQYTLAQARGRTSSFH